MSDQTEALLVYSTFPTLEEAKSVSRSVVELKLAACANILPGMISVYEWEDKLEEGNEVVAIFKTCRDRKDDLMSKIDELHSYSVPAIVVLEASDVGASYLQWLLEQTKS